MSNNEWRKGNQPGHEGLYWATVKNSRTGEAKVYERPMLYEHGEWHLLSLHGSSFYKEDIIAYMEIKKPDVWNPNKIGFSNEFYIRVTHKNGSVSHYSKQLAPIEWSMIGYSDKGKAKRAMQRLRKLLLEESGGQSAEDVYEVVTGDGDTV